MPRALSPDASSCSRPTTSAACASGRSSTSIWRVGAAAADLEKVLQLEPGASDAPALRARRAQAPWIPRSS